ncbi:MAG: tRNA 5-methoxyuridine(34)/uridine 5-oxyacetic acid(34) synthase CmoB, partial [Bdellovibrionales bacterium]|nr:tRNA 5-methoxyuridine(34)/uridine 5-oxyacetic acid(34) synthase CmoB [Bdellovibrionales bacterium]
MGTVKLKEVDSCLYRPLWLRTDPLLEYQHRYDWERIEAQRAKAIDSLHTAHWNNCRALCAAVWANLRSFTTNAQFLDDGFFSLRTDADTEIDQLESLLKRLIPWRNGPYLIQGHPIDAEWRSDFKWERIQKHLPNLKDKRIAEVGCNNGYVMARLRDLGPRLIVGLDPSERCFFQFELMQAFLRDERLHFELGTGALLEAFENFFDFILCQGVIYHRKDPIGFLQDLNCGLRLHGTVLLESMCIAQAGSQALCVSGRYAKMHNVYFIPTPAALVTWLETAGFEVLKVFCLEKTTSEEQR